jgi:beta-galactosidase
MNAYAPGTLTARGYIKSKKVTENSVSTPDAPAKIKITVDLSGKELKAGCNDVVFVYASITDAKGNIVPTDNRKIAFKVEGDASLIGVDSIEAEAGIATVLLKAGGKPGNIKIKASGEGLETGILQVISK